MHKIQSTVSFETAHRLFDVATYSEECRDNVHGHSYYVTVQVGRSELNESGMVMDFKLFKKILRSTIEDVYDHACVLKSDDPLVNAMKENCKKVIVVTSNPTAEWMSLHFASLIQCQLNLIDDQLQVVSVAVQETERNIAIFEPEVE